MKKEILIHGLSFIIFFVLITILHKGFIASYILFWIGGLVGTVLPDIDHLIYIYLLRPYELTSQRANNLIQKGALSQSANLLVATSIERTNMIFHTLWFQLVFLGFTLWAVTSSGNLFGHGLTLAFSLHILMDQLIDFLDRQNLNSWFEKYANLSREKQLLYWLAIAATLLFLAFL